MVNFKLSIKIYDKFFVTFLFTNAFLSLFLSANSSDSEELSAGESVTKTQPVKSVCTGMKSHSTKSPARTQSPGKCGKNGDKDPDLKESSNRLPKVYKWSFQMCK